MEVTIATTEASNVLTTLSELIPDVIGLFPTHAEKLRAHADEIRKVQCVVNLIRSQKPLRTFGVVAGISALQTHGTMFKEDLIGMGEGGKPDLRKTMENIKRGRRSLIQQICAASVGLAKDGGGYTVDTKVVRAIEEATKKSLGKDTRLEFPLFLSKLKRNPDKNGKLTLSKHEFREWTMHQIKLCDPEAKAVTAEAKTRIISNCLAKDQSIQILGPIGVDLWAAIDFIKTEGCISTDQAIQFAYPQTFEVFLEGLDRQEKRIASTRVKQIEAK